MRLSTAYSLLLTNLDAAICSLEGERPHPRVAREVNQPRVVRGDLIWQDEVGCEGAYA